MVYNHETLGTTSCQSRSFCNCSVKGDANMEILSGTLVSLLNYSWTVVEGNLTNKRWHKNCVICIKYFFDCAVNDICCWYWNKNMSMKDGSGYVSVTWQWCTMEYLEKIKIQKWREKNILQVSRNRWSSINWKIEWQWHSMIGEKFSKLTYMLDIPLK